MKFFSGLILLFVFVYLTSCSPSLCDMGKVVNKHITYGGSAYLYPIDRYYMDVQYIRNNEAVIKTVEVDSVVYYSRFDSVIIQID